MAGATCPVLLAMLRWKLTSERRVRKSCEMITENELMPYSKSLQERDLLLSIRGRLWSNSLLPVSTYIGNGVLIADSSVVWHTKVCLTRCS